MIAVIGGAKATVKIKQKAPAKGAESDRAESMAAGPAASEMAAGDSNGAGAVSGDDDIIVENSGCGFNIAVHLARMGHRVSFLSVVGTDLMGTAIAEQLNAAGIDIRGLKRISATTPIDVQMFNILGDVELSWSNDLMYAEITPETVKEWTEILEEARFIVVDGSLPRRTLEYIAEIYGTREGVRIFFDPASRRGGEKAAGILDKLYCVMPGRTEAEAMTGGTILSEDQLMAAGSCLHEKGVVRTIITMKGGGLYYKEGMVEGILRPERVLSFAGTSGAGDIVSAAVIAGTWEEKSMEETARQAMEMAADFLSERKDERPI